MKKLAFAVMVSTLAFTGATFAQEAASSPAPTRTDVTVTKEAPAAPAQTSIDVKTEQPAPAASVSADINITKTETSPAPAPVSTSTTTTEVWGLDGKTVLIGGALLLGIILIAVAAAGRDRSTTVVR